MTRFVFLSLVIFSAPLLAFSQQAANATLTGTITDPMGAVISGTKITATQTATGARRDTVTNDDGYYVFSNMPPGDYELAMEATGFARKVTKPPVSLKVGQTLTLNVQLEVDMAKADVHTLTYTLPLIDRSSCLIDGVIWSREVESLPLNGRNFLELALLVPGNTLAP